ncbi:serine/threonine protein kinase [Histoplasma capsulatum]|uniref:Serine/threonine protein kinase n=1 Tax=Ajellomyces capsulatus TaxID=5037 RepID=A0A8A1M1F2_AJECA|nr:serine/threonine protein kinase [Histoplasma capsulatum]
MEKGHRRTYLDHNRPLQRSWFREIRRGLYITVQLLWRDIASRNFLRASDLSIWFCDFTMSSVLPLDTNIKAAGDNGYSAQTDIGLLWAVIYEVVTGERCKFDHFKRPATRSL